MIVTIPAGHEHTVAHALARDAARVIDETGIVPGYLHAYAEVWKQVYAPREGNFWRTVWNLPEVKPSVVATLARRRQIMRRAGLTPS